MLEGTGHGRVWLIFFCIFGFFSLTAHAGQFNVLVVMSYEEAMPWQQQIKEGIDKILEETCTLKYFYMNTKTDLKNGPQKAEEAYTLYQQFRPDGVIAADDNAQSMFVVPYLKNKVETPVMFCGVNTNPGKYGYPADNVSGILERHHFNESIAFAQQLFPSIKTVAYMIKESPVGELIIKEIQEEANTYPAEYIGHRTPKTVAETVAMTSELREKCDLLILSTMRGVEDKDGKPLTDKEMIPLVAKVFGKPVIGTEEQVVKAGALCSVQRTGQEQGQTAAKMLLKAMQGTPVHKIPITRNYQGNRIINVSVMKALNINPKPEILLGAELVRTEE